ncbi:MAG: copper amine oxidase N-terminal domain-containing protein [Clostridia bacterium]|nr:copper amine oxidase N-terminal domain-containing protein [Clostridia bacterium]
MKKNFIKGFIVGAMLFGSGVLAGTTLDAIQVSFPILVNGEAKTFDKPVVVIEGSTYLPLRAMGNVLGVNVSWNEEKRQVEISRDDLAPAIPLIEAEAKDTIRNYINIRNASPSIFEIAQNVGLIDKKDSISNYPSQTINDTEYHVSLLTHDSIFNKLCETMSRDLAISFVGDGTKFDPAKYIPDTQGYLQLPNIERDPHLPYALDFGSLKLIEENDTEQKWKVVTTFTEYNDEIETNVITQIDEYFTFELATEGDHYIVTDVSTELE